MELGKGKLSVGGGGSKANKSNEFGVLKVTRKLKHIRCGSKEKGIRRKLRALNV